jgi:hypothetical protein
VRSAVRGDACCQGRYTYRAKADDSKAVGAWRERGTAKVRCVLLLHALAHNLMRTFALAPELLGYGRGASSESAMAT